MKKENNNNKEKKNKIIFISLIILLTIITFSNSLFNEVSLYDDQEYIIGNALLRGLSFHDVRMIFSTFVMGNYHPLVVLCDAIIYNFFKLNPIAYHSLSLLLHLINIVLVFNLVYLLIVSQQSVISNQINKHKIQPSALVGCLFAIHPMHCETICWASDLKDLLFTLFYLSSLIYYIKFIKYKTQENKNSKVKSQKLKINSTDISQQSAEQSQKLKVKSQKVKFYLISLLLFVCSCLSKSAAVTFPIIMIATDYLLKRKISISTMLAKVPFFSLSIIFGIINLYSQASAEAFFDTSNYNIIDSIFFPIYNLCYYIISTVIPYKLSVIHPYPIKIDNHLPIVYYLFSLIILILLVLIIRIIMKLKNKNNGTGIHDIRYIIFGILFFVINLVLVLQIIPVGMSEVSERYTYLSYFGLFFIIGQLYELQEFKRITRRNLNILVVFILLLFSFISHERNKVWVNNLSLYNDVIKKYPGSYLAYNNRGNAKASTGDMSGAIEDFNKATELNPQYVLAFNNRGNAKASVGDIQGSMNDFNKAIEINPLYAEAFINRGITKYKLGDYKGAINDYNIAFVLNTKASIVYKNRANANCNLGNNKEAIDDYNIAIRLNPLDGEALNNKGNAEYNLGNKVEACIDWNKASKLGFKESFEMINKYCE